MRFTAEKLQEEKMVDNKQGTNASYSLEPEQELFKMALTSFVDKSFYETMNDKVVKLREYCKQCDVDFVIKLATWARSKGLRTVNQIMLVESLAHPDFIAHFQNLVSRPDEIIDILGYYVMVNKQNATNIKLASKLKKAIKMKLETFGDYQLAKYKGKGDVINLYDLVNLTHPKSVAIDKLMKGTLQSADTWESELSANGNTIESRTTLLEGNKVGALAFIRNLRNMIQVGIGHDKLESYLQTIDFTRLFPFQTIQSVDVCVREAGLATKSPLYKALEKKIYESFTSFAKLFKGKTAVGVDISGSMHTAINAKSQLQRQTMAAYYGQGLQDHGADIYARGNGCYDATEFSIEQFYKFNEGTNVNSLLSGVKRSGKKYDTLFIITDEQSRMSIGASDIPNIIVWNIADYNHTIVPTYTNGYTYVTGFNDAQFELIDDLRDLPALIKKIKSL